MKPGEDTAAICGFFCGTCPSYPEICGGCLSQRVAPGCDSCHSGFRDCVKSHHITRCYECADFPCGQLTKFSKRHVVNGNRHHAHLINNLRNMKEQGLYAWVESQTAEYTCPHCGRTVLCYERQCPVCVKS